METKVRVGVRVRPLLPNEEVLGSEMVMKYPGDCQIGMGERFFTYDHVFGPDILQSKLYSLTAKPMLKPFLEGYNVTIIAYGQTGSGKTYTMGSEVGHLEMGSSTNSLGLIPRFVDDLFAHFQSRERHEARVAASFLEIYGEDVYDLLDESNDASTSSVGGSCRSSLPIREDAAQGVMVAGLKQIEVSSRAEALQVLRRGTMNRTTAATLMNDTSSRSHAVFTVTLQQMIYPNQQTSSSSSSKEEGEEGGEGKQNDGPEAGEGGNNQETEGQLIVSKLTFVDLAGSERLKRTGAEGERRREGIQINVGLLALGSVINALADEERLSKGRRVHVPYRQSKLTRLLQDALGGNSQTLFLACVSPADINASETLSTLYYANRARNIRNKPVKNTDSVKEELRCLRQTAHFLKAEMIRQKFDIELGSNSKKDQEFMEKPEVKSFLEALGTKLDGHLRRVGIEGIDGPTLLMKPLAPATPGGTRSPGPQYWPQEQSRRLSHFGGGASDTASSTSSPCRSITYGTRLEFSDTINSSTASLPTDEQHAAAAGGPSFSNSSSNQMMMQQDLARDPEKEMAILEKLKELQQHEAQMGEESEQGREELANVEGELEQKENLLEQLKQTLEGYHGMRARYEKLWKEVEALEYEKEGLQGQLEQAMATEAKRGSSAPGVTAQLREKLRGVESQLDRLKIQKRQQENLQRLAERQRQELKALEENCTKLKHTKAQLMKNQREAQKKHEKIIQQKRHEVEALRKADRNLQKRIGRLQLENRGHKVMMDRKDQCIKTLKAKAADAQTHVMRLLQLQTRTREPAHRRAVEGRARVVGGSSRAPTPHTCTGGGGANKKTIQAASSLDNEKVEAARFLIEKLVEERLGDLEARRSLEQKVREYEKMVQELKTQATTLEKIKGPDVFGVIDDVASFTEEEAAAIQEAEERMEGLDMEMELCAGSICDLQARLDSYEANAAINSTSTTAASSKGGRPPPAPLNEKSTLKALSELGANEARALLSSMVEGMVEAKARVWELENDMKRKSCAEECLRIDKRRLERRLSASARGFEQRLVEMRSQHQQDLITLVKGATTTTTAAAAEEGSGGGRDSRVTDGRIAGGREGEEEEAADKADQVARRQLEALVGQNDALESRCQALTGELEIQRSEMAKLTEDAEAARKEAKDLRSAIEALRATVKKDKGDDDQAGRMMEELLTVWAELGLTEEKREAYLTQVRQAPQTVCLGLLQEAHASASATKTEITDLQTKISKLEEVLDCLPASSSIKEGSSKSGMLLLRGTLQARYVELKAILTQRWAQARRLASEAQKLQQSLGREHGSGEREGEGVAAFASDSPLHALLKLWQKVQDQEASDDSDDEGDGLGIKYDDLEAGALSEATIGGWEAEVKAFRRTRSTLVLDLQGLLEQAHGACCMMVMSPKELRRTIATVAKRKREDQNDDAFTADSLNEAALNKLGIAVTSGGAAVAAVWAEDGTLPLRQAAPQARFIVDVLVECWSRRRELLDLCQVTEEALLESVGAEYQEEARSLLLLPEIDSEEGARQNGGLSSDQAETFVEGMEAILKKLDDRQSEAQTTLEGLWNAFAVDAEDRDLDFSSEVPMYRSSTARAAFERFQRDLDKMKNNARIKGKYEDWIDDLLARMEPCLEQSRALVQNLIILEEHIGVYSQRKRRQDSILKLNDDIMNLEVSARKFETDASDRTRLVDRKTNSVRLLKEEKFRKDSKARFAKWLDKLRQELDEWGKREGTPFDRTLLGEDIQRSLTLSAEGGRNWVEGRTELMHLHTGQPQPRSRGSSPSDLSPVLLNTSPDKGTGQESFSSATVITAASSSTIMPPPPPSPVKLNGAAHNSTVTSTTTVPPTSNTNNTVKRDPFARVLSPAVGGSGGTLMPPPPPRPPPTRPMGGLLCLNRLIGANQQSVSDIVRGGIPTPSTTTIKPQVVKTKPSSNQTVSSSSSLSPNRAEQQQQQQQQEGQQPPPLGEKRRDGDGGTGRKPKVQERRLSDQENAVDN